MIKSLACFFLSCVVTHLTHRVLTSRVKRGPLKFPIKTTLWLVDKNSSRNNHRSPVWFYLAPFTEFSKGHLVLQRHPHPPPIHSRANSHYVFLMVSTVLPYTALDVTRPQLMSTPSLAARRCRCTWSCSSSSWLGCQRRERMRSMFSAYIVCDGITPW